jgi:hypothetical protein
VKPSHSTRARSAQDSGSARRAAHSCHQREQRQRHQHAQGEQRGGIDAVAQAELDDDRLARRGDGADRGQADAAQRNAWGSDAGSGVDIRTTAGRAGGQGRRGAPIVAWRW